MMSMKPRKQRKELYNAPLHKRRKWVSAHLEENLLLKYDKRAITVVKGDTVRVIRGSFRGHEDKVAKVNVKKRNIEIEGITMSKADGNKIAKPIPSSNVTITKLNLTDKWRRKKLERDLSEETKKEIEKEAEEQIKEVEEEKKIEEEKKALEEEKEAEGELEEPKEIEEPEVKPKPKVEKKEEKPKKPKAEKKPSEKKKTPTKKKPTKEKMDPEKKQAIFAPRIEKVTINIGVGESGERLEKARTVLNSITDHKPIETLSRTTNKDWGIRKRMPIGCKVTLRGKDANNFLKEALSTRENKMADYSFDDEGNLSFGIPDHTLFKSQKYDPNIGIFGMDVCITMQKPGYRIKRRRIATRKMPHRHRVKKEESIKFFSETFNMEVIQ